MTVLVYIVPAKGGKLKKRLDGILENLRSSTFQSKKTQTKEYWYHTTYKGKVEFEDEGQVCVIKGNDDDSEAFTLGAFLNWVYRNAKEEIYVATIIFPQAVAD